MKIITINTAFIRLAGDRTVGLADTTAELKGHDTPLFDGSLIDPDQQAECIEELRTKLADAMAVVWDGRPSVIFDFEIDALNVAEDTSFETPEVGR